jgi:uncharacterized protein (DUF2147 family)
MNYPLTALSIALIVPATIAISNPVASRSPEITIAQNATPAFVGRVWEGENKNFRVQFYKKNNVYNGKIVWIAPGGETKDVKNPDPKLRSRNLIGTTMLQGFTYDPNKKQLTGGVVYVPEMGRVLKPTLSVVSNDRMEMKVSMGFMSRTVALTAVN